MSANHRSASDPATRSAALAYRPVKNVAVEVQQMESGDLILSYPVVVRPWLDRLLGRLGRKPSEPLRRKVQLDALGTQVWGWIDGARTVGEIVAAFGEAQKLPRREAELSVTAFVRMLGKRGLIGLQEPDL